VDTVRLFRGNSKIRRPIARAALLVVVVLSHAGLVGLLLRMAPKPAHDDSAAVVSWLTLIAPVPPKQAPAAAIAPAGDLSAPAPAPPRIVKPARPLVLHDPCAPPRHADDKRRRDPACPGKIAVAPPLALPGSLHQDDWGNVTPDRSSIFAGLPPETPDRIEAAAAAHFAALEDVFGPPYEAAPSLGGPNPVGAFGPIEKGRLVQFVEDRLNARPLVPQSTIRADP
jgi:hypothetical protein